MNHDPEQLKRVRELFEESKDPFKRFLNSDIGSIFGCEEILATIHEIQADRTQTRERDGNAYWVDMTTDGVTLQNQWDEEMPILEYSLKEFEALLLDYIEHLKSKGKE